MEAKNLINLQRFLYVLRRRFVWIILIALILGLIAGVFTKLFVKPEYSAFTKFYVNASENQSHLTQSDMNVAKSLVDTYIEIVKSDTFLEEIAEVAGVNYSPAKIRSIMEASSVGGTEIFKVTISDPDKKTAYLIASAMAEKGPQEIKRVVECGSVNVVDKPKMPVQPSGIGLKRNVALGMLVGAAIVFSVFFVKEAFDVTVYSEDDLTENFDYPVIGTIPSIEISQDKQKKSEKSGDQKAKTEKKEAK